MKKFYTTIIIALISLNAISQSQNWAWAKGAGGVSNDEGKSIGVDGSGNSYVTGWFSGSSIAFGSTTLSNMGSTNMFIVKYDANGNVIWAKSGAGNSTSQGTSISVDVNGNSYVTGWFSTSFIVFGSTVLTNPSGSKDVFIVKYDTNGNVVWAKSIEGSDDEESWGVCEDGGGNSYVTGDFRSATIYFGSFTLAHSITTGKDFFIAKFDANGNAVWAKSAGGHGVGNAIDADASGNIYVTGASGSTLTFGNITLTCSNMFLVKYDSTGNAIWGRTPMTNGGSSIVVDAIGNSYVAGSYLGSPLIFGNDTLLNNGYDDIFIAKYDTNGNAVWAISAGSNNFDYAKGIALDGFGNCYVAGHFDGPSITLGNTTLINPTGEDLFVMKSDANGNILWAQSAGGNNGGVQASGIAADGSGNCYISGKLSYGSSIDFGNTTLINSGPSSTSDIFVAKLGMMVGIEEGNIIDGISVAPNPFTSQITISNTKHLVQSIKIMDVLGNVILKQVQNDRSVTIDMSGFAKGVYFVEVATNDKIIRKRIIKN